MIARSLDPPKEKQMLLATTLRVLLSLSPFVVTISVSVQTYLDCPCQMEKPIPCVKLFEEQAEVSRLKNSKLRGADIIDECIIKQLPEKRLLFLVPIFNCSFRLSHFPTQRKCAESIVISKPSKPKNEI